MVVGLGLVSGHFDVVVLVISRLGLMVARLELVVGFGGCWVGIGGKDSVVVLCGATTVGGGFDSGGCWVGILVVGGGGCL